MCAVESGSADLSRRVVKGFGEEWSRFTNQTLSDHELREMFELYASVFPWQDLPENAVGFDAGCGSGAGLPFLHRE